MSGERILVVDDDLELSEQVGHYLVQRGLGPLTAPGGSEALSLLAEQEFDLVLLDIIMPGMDGFAVCREIRESSLVPIIMLSAIGDEAAKVQMLQTGADDYMVKPFSLPELYARVQAVLRRTGMSGRDQELSGFT